MIRKSRTAEIIISALPYIRKFRDKIFVIKYGGAAQIDENLKANFARDIVLLHMVGIKIIVVHGGGKKINETLDKIGITSEFKDGLRVTSKECVEVTEMVLSGLVNKEITALLNQNGAPSIGISGKDGDLLRAKFLDEKKYGFVGVIDEVNTNFINDLLEKGYLPVIAPLATDENGISYNINADLCASKVASALKADKVIFLSDIDGVLDKEGKLISKLDEKLINKFKKDGTISGGMIPKMDACLECVKAGALSAHIINGKIPHSLLLELFTDDGIGSLIKEKF
ncbi:MULTISPECIES: acetylglutamate kinase [unclassified Campylobacter]|uniref:acetylglutamate kinase n=1 Tax=unclassified Campylobacter TaxID=2593542 RepID=UPI0022E9AAE2|nr:MULTISPECIES: acetylglutamate kinase [unclassified Campylobacter]MDA3080352.1 acetylglutamate kinase [Campylobacter sp. CS_NA2]MDA3081783.1 acetylglutamate kinase [Campylobacter sp. CS_NA1]MDA3086409.1 acetylglutamate kinase [Campylobacter sp. CS_ED1]MDA3089681.1 acetylglutamate kinase [Campylobacter sp. CS_ED2]WBR51755.1 acetylglutamate kinase [Campylobacter sp. CS_NA3]